MSSFPSTLTQDLRHQLASTISDFKSYEVPAICTRLGLADGTDDEAFQSKFKYAQKRLVGVGLPDLKRMAQNLLDEKGDYYLAEIVAKIDEDGTPPVTELTRRRLIGEFDGAPLATQIEDVELLQRVWPVATMQPSYAGRDNLLDEVYQHTIRNDDWSQTDLLMKMGLLTCSKAQLFKFLHEVTHPVVQKPGAQLALVTRINNHLQHDGYRLAVVGKLSGSPVYEVKAAILSSPADNAISNALKAFDPNDVHDRWVAAVERRADDPRGAITLARTLLEDVCKWILHEAGESYQDKDDLPVLYRKLAKVLKLAPDEHTEQTFKQLLGSCQQIVELLGSLRSKLGDAHSPGPKKAKPQPRHAELAVNLSGTMATFLVETWRARKAESAKAAAPDTNHGNVSD
ncbi:MULTISPECIES: abortive infection family protein [Rhizobium/Agrobacterium group]|uniref:abortive infection family protein n=1 Tax=Rhizobium/Agrobacterium group TaxID=227290 RepID=UPI0023018543|nr:MULTISPECIES: abortive infection family protein [Rhizobium/Agrobacterium group]MDA5635760.1 abortive infection family protein [Agrobacterium sp. ST15.16.024]MDF1891525.1 abortive infection family protein [Rhizobium rhizogenes]